MPQWRPSSDDIPIYIQPVEQMTDCVIFSIHKYEINMEQLNSWKYLYAKNIVYIVVRIIFHANG